MRRWSHCLLWAAFGAAHGGMAQQPLDLDPSFRPPIDQHWIGSDSYISDIRSLSDGRILVSSSWLRVEGSLDYWTLLVLNSDGSVNEHHFGGSGAGGGGRIAPWNDRLYIQGNGPIYRTDLDGTLDTAFHSWETNLPFLSLTQQGDYHVNADGSVLLTGIYRILAEDSTDLGEFNVIRLDPHGGLDRTFTPRKANGAARYIFPTANGKFLVSGNFEEYDGTYTGALVRILPDGSRDTTFHAPLGVGYVRSCYHYADGRILVGGAFAVENEPDTLHLVRLFPDGQWDPAFQAHLELELFPGNSPAAVTINAIHPYGPDRLIIGGEFWSADGLRRGGLAMIDTAGALIADELDYQGCDSVAVAGFPAGGVLGIEELPDGDLYVYGTFTGFGDQVGFHPEQVMLVRLWPMDVGVAERTAGAPQWSIWPVPGADEVHLAPATPAREDLQLRVQDATGRVILQRTVPAATSTITLDTGVFAPGIYFFTLSNGAGRSSTRRWIRT